MFLEKIILIDLDDELIKEWQKSFSEYNEVVVVQDDYFVMEADAMVSPANSFGVMDGGLDHVIRYELGAQVEERVQQEIVSQYHGELPVGCAVIVETSTNKWPKLIAAPTMRVPMDISDTINPYLAFRAILNEVKNYNKLNIKNAIKSLVCPGLGTGIGNVSAPQCAYQMKLAYECFVKPAEIPGFNQIRSSHKSLMDYKN
ncbi:macro domain-containing protein [Sessilibacter corallicola]|uniref:macro domain-containing protein n=1 Tax=Sessilibacter corallicola TaxID=2904075 RepID=UPI001E56D596|nr:macro domain-containing protein [Sessilibacter corallicola]MCE2030192.1 macro domain-containing protein [Sessilibacter corallicola]